ncbi:alpha/beta hydrolase [Streptomyces omiyaensis]|uniref:alpha/beta hydrolase n=1 Tax=Streptomyces omiyaensis TaxID=68247 RepID=UPI001674EA3C|nr:alpha/beta hydrolase [Streptomyces omiyaensis]GGY81599.1 hypothetical protein GCM10010363_73040 [Streptomyces omiyaensis]
MARRPRSRRRPLASVPGRFRRTVLAGLVTASVAVPVAGAARPAEVPAPVPAAVAPLRAGTADVLAARLEERYAAERVALAEAGRTAEEYGAGRRAASLREMAGADRRFLEFDGRDGGRSAEVVGDLARADRIAVLVPGADTGLDAYGRFRAGAVALQGAAGGRTAVVAWLGYRTPATGSAASLTPGRADQAAPRLRAFVEGLARMRPGARITLLGHSYGSVVCARAAPGLPVAAVVLFGSPGTGSDHVTGLGTDAAVWAGRSDGDWIGGIPHVRVPLLAGSELGFGTDPTDPGFGARAFAAGDGGHSDYLAPGSVSLRSLALIVGGEEPDRA